MTRAQRWIVVAAAALLLCTIFFPPWVGTWQHTGISAVHRPLGWSPIFSPPESASGGVGLDWSRLLLEWMSIALVVAAAWALSSSRAGTLPPRSGVI